MDTRNPHDGISSRPNPRPLWTLEQGNWGDHENAKARKAEPFFAGTSLPLGDRCARTGPAGRNDQLSLVIRATRGKNKETTMNPTMPPNTIIKSGSMSRVSASVMTFTSSS